MLTITKKNKITLKKISLQCNEGLFVFWQISRFVLLNFTWIVNISNKNRYYLLKFSFIEKCYQHWFVNTISQSIDLPNKINIVYIKLMFTKFTNFWDAYINRFYRLLDLYLFYWKHFKISNNNRKCLCFNAKLQIKKLVLLFKEL